MTGNQRTDYLNGLAPHLAIDAWFYEWGYGTDMWEQVIVDEVTGIAFTISVHRLGQACNLDDIPRLELATMFDEGFEP